VAQVRRDRGLHSISARWVYDGGRLLYRYDDGKPDVETYASLMRRMDSVVHASDREAAIRYRGDREPKVRFL
jgi:hypothetical protein